MKSISPLTLGLILLALPVLAWLWWTSDEAAAPVGAVSRGDVPLAAGAGDESRPSKPRPVRPVDTYSVMVDRPLFAATRHPLEDKEVAPPIDFDGEVEPAPPADNIADRYRLVGTVEEDGRVFALLAGNDGSFVRVRRGDRLEDWTVNAINRQRVLMVSGEQATELMLRPEGLR